MADAVSAYDDIQMWMESLHVKDAINAHHKLMQAIKAARAAITALDAVRGDGWRTMESAPKDVPIIGWCNHAADEYVYPDGNLTTYGAHCEGASYADDGCHILEWGGYYEEEGFGRLFHVSDWWFVRGSEWEVVANPTHWRPLPLPPKEGT